MVAGQHRHHPGPGAADLHDHPAGPADHVGAAHRAQAGADQPGAGAQADQPGRPHPPRQRGLRVGQRQVPGDLRRAVGRLGVFPRQRRIRRGQLRDHPAGDEPQVRAQRAARHPGQARRAAREPLDHRRVQQYLRHRVQAQPDRVVRELRRGPQQVLGPLPPARGHRRDHVPGERGGLRRHRRRPPGRDVAGDQVSAAISGRTGNHTVDIQYDMTGTPGPCHPETVRPDPSHQAQASQIAAELAAIASSGMVLPGSIKIGRAHV